ncbi:IS110 family transposase [Leptospira borgpetersenii]|uniref:Transposase, IS1533 n=4 Tax=Leptospira borgpetersenii TaxID=174 RepID=Q04T08_LEPBJ|nr:IS110 family transposase [Leptospira borgpetersenii]ABJ75633.1 Transposase, IS1533 [Leptospira borgpetersenii serovar Hardjo-bovis str. JB197]ABJ75958.1 Transposase, IS1533 [Leptospira borgpetersenii serovar Hardjo-bovis str. JB197]ABJ75962.1 Transposase, IS1533 [Leptospira borgpetersenii serovar Hardjo-bovis str. JB197]ABJ78475.1 Transposase, IS1533 [Leptospira borgpetersenii serovar Hardjo-bovis str. L550]AWV69598.1 IS110 family transposase [Leptospira borgpetersenii serovar Hardjo-bovis]
MKRKVYVGMDVHKETIQIAYLTSNSKEILKEQQIKHNEVQIKKFIKKLKTEWNEIYCCYEAGVTGYPLYRYLKSLGVNCILVAPGKIPRQNTDKIKTDKRDAIKLARLMRSGELESIHVPSEEDEAVRDYLRSRDSLRLDLGRNRQRLMKFLLRKDIKYSTTKYWTVSHYKWLNNLHFNNEILQETFNDYYSRVRVQEENLKSMDKKIQEIAESEPYREKVGILRCFRGVDYLTAMFLLCEVNDFKRFKTAGSFMSFLGLVPGEYSSGSKRKQTGITKTGSPRLRRILTEAAWQHRFPGTGSKIITARRSGQPALVVALSEKASLRLHKKFRNLQLRGKTPQVMITAVSRELSGFLWAAMNLVA